MDALARRTPSRKAEWVGSLTDTRPRGIPHYARPRETSPNQATIRLQSGLEPVQSGPGYLTFEPVDGADA